VRKKIWRFFSLRLDCDVKNDTGRPRGLPLKRESKHEVLTIPSIAKKKPTKGPSVVAHAYNPVIQEA
jgi:hypothetical protein